MIITCEACNTSFNLDESRLAPAGSKVRCSNCKMVFMAYPPSAEAKADSLLKDDMAEGGSEPDRVETDLALEMDTGGEDVAADAQDREAEELEDLDLSNLELELEIGEGRDDEEIDEFKELELELEELDQEEQLAGKEEPVVTESFEDLKAEETETDNQEPVLEGIQEIEDRIGDDTEDLKLELDDLDELGILESETGEGVGETVDSSETDEFELGDVDFDLDETDTPTDQIVEEASEIEFKELDEQEIPTEEKVVSGDAPLKDGEEDDLELGDLELVLDELEEEKRGEMADAESDVVLGEETDEPADMTEVLEMDTPLDTETEEELTFESLDESEIVESEMATSHPDLFKVEEISRDEVDETVESFSLGDGQEPSSTAETGPSVGFDESGPDKKRTSRWFIGMLVIVVLLGGAYVALNYLNVEIPFLSGLTETKDLDPRGNLNITLINYNGNFMDNAHAGKLYVVRGQARNDYSEPRGFIQVTGSLYSRGKMLIKKQTVFAGNVLSDLDLANLELGAIQKRLQNRTGDNGANIRLEPGKQVSFMVVFSDLPDTLEEFRLDVEGSMKIR